MGNNYRSVLASGGGVQPTGDAVAGDVLTGKTFSNANAIGISGSMPNNGAVSGVASASQPYTVPAGYHNGSGVVTAEVPNEIVSFDIYTGNSSVTIASDGLAYIWCQDTSGTYNVTKNGTPIAFDNIVSTTATTTYPCAVVPVSTGDVIAYSTPGGHYVNIMLGVVSNT